MCQNDNTNKFSAFQAYLDYLEESGETDSVISKKEFKQQLMDDVSHTFQNRVVIKRVRYEQKDNTTARVLSLVNIRLASQPPQNIEGLEDQKDPSTTSPPSLGALETFAKSKKPPSIDKISVSNNQIQIEQSETSCIGQTKSTVYSASNPPPFTTCLSLQEIDWLALENEKGAHNLLDILYLYVLSEIIDVRATI